MRYKLALLALLAVLPAATADGKLQVTARHGKSLKGTVDGYPFLLLRGALRERAVDHGFLAAREILAALDQGIIPTINKQIAATWENLFIPAAGRFEWPRRYEEELQGLLVGIAQAIPKKEDRVLKSLGREIALADLKALNALSDILPGGCSSFSAWGAHTKDGELLTARNLDYMAFPIASALSIVAVEPAEKELRPTIDVIGPGIVGASTALNADGLFLAIHDEAGLPRSRKQGWVPRFLALRTAIESSRDIEGVTEVLRRSPVKVGSNIHVSTSSAAAVLEWDGNAKEEGVTVRRPKEGASSIVCTNHYVQRAERKGSPSSLNRYATLEKAIASGKKIDLEAAQAMLESVCVNGGSVTHLSVVAWPKARRIAFAFSPQNGVSATRGKWVTVEWDELFKN